MKRSLFLSLALGFAAFYVASFLCTYCLIAPDVEKKAISDEADALYDEGYSIANTFVSYYYNQEITLGELYEQISVLSQYMDVTILVLNSTGNVIVDSSDPDFDEDDLSFRSIDGFDASDFDKGSYNVGDFYTTFDTPMLNVLAPITFDYQVRGYITLHKPYSGVVSDVNSMVNRIYQTLTIAFAISLLLLAYIIFLMVLPLRKISKVARKYARSDFSEKLDTSRSDTIGQIAKSLDAMGYELDTLEEDQRKFVSNVSHDFRSPLTSIKGYAVAMQDGTIPAEKQEKYLGIIVYEAERLTKLTEDLLSLNQMGRKGALLNIAPFDLIDEIKKTAATFEMACRKKSISFDLILTGEEATVMGDVGRIRQVLYNLCDNAIKFSMEKSVVTIETTERNDKIYVSVKDTGTGISKDDLPKIWDRFYKADQSRGKDKKGTGLGLAIVKEIISLHNEDITVVSTEGVGTEFTFTLTKA